MKNFLKKLFDNTVFGILMGDIWVLLILPLMPIFWMIANSMISSNSDNKYDIYQELAETYEEVLSEYRYSGVLVHYSLSYLLTYIAYIYFVRKLSKISKEILKEQEI